MGVHLPPAHRLLAVALRISTHPGSASNAYYQELLGISVSVLASRTMPLAAFLDFSSAITRAHQSLSLLGPVVGHLQHDSLLLGIRALSMLSPLPLTLTWMPSHPKRKKSQSTWTDSDWGIHMADAIAGNSPLEPAPGLQLYHCNSEEVHPAIMTPGTWHWKWGPRPFHGSLSKRVQRTHFHQYKQKWDMNRIYAN